MYFGKVKCMLLEKVPFLWSLPQNYYLYLCIIVINRRLRHYSRNTCNKVNWEYYRRYFVHDNDRREVSTPLI